MITNDHLPCNTGRGAFCFCPHGISIAALLSLNLFASDAVWLWLWLWSRTTFRFLLHRWKWSTIYNINWMDCTMLKNSANTRFQDPTFLAPFYYFGAVFGSLSRFFTDHYHYLIDLFHRQLQLFLLQRMLGSSKRAENQPHFLRSVAISEVYPVYIIHRWKWYVWNDLTHS